MSSGPPQLLYDIENEIKRFDGSQQKLLHDEVEKELDKYASTSVKQLIADSVLEYIEEITKWPEEADFAKLSSALKDKISLGEIFSESEVEFRPILQSLINRFIELHSKLMQYGQVELKRNTLRTIEGNPLNLESWLLAVQELEEKEKNTLAAVLENKYPLKSVILRKGAPDDSEKERVTRNTVLFYVENNKVHLCYLNGMGKFISQEINDVALVNLVKQRKGERERVVIANPGILKRIATTLKQELQIGAPLPPTSNDTIEFLGKIFGHFRRTGAIEESLINDSITHLVNLVTNYSNAQEIHREILDKIRDCANAIQDKIGARIDSRMDQIWLKVRQMEPDLSSKSECTKRNTEISQWINKIKANAIDIRALESLQSLELQYKAAFAKRPFKVDDLQRIQNDLETLWANDNSPQMEAVKKEVERLERSLLSKDKINAIKAALAKVPMNERENVFNNPKNSEVRDALNIRRFFKVPFARSYSNIEEKYKVAIKEAKSAPGSTLEMTNMRQNDKAGKNGPSNS